jgi:DNA-binding transcriptional ArsR family regulator
MGQEILETIVTFFKAMADENRLRIIGLLAQKEATGEELAAMLGLHQATISHHVSRLTKAGLIDARPEGYYSVYRLNSERLQSLAKQLLSAGHLAAVTEDLDSSAYDKKVLQSFMTSSGRLKSIPTQRKKRAAILRYLVQQLKPEQRYSERQINNVLKRYHVDTAWLRREMISEKLLARQEGQYWRTV